MSEIIMEIIGNITGFVSFFAPGYFFLSCFFYASCLEREDSTEYLIIKCVSISYIIFVFSQIAAQKLHWSELEMQAFGFGFTIMIGWIFGRLYRVQWVNQLSLFFFNRELSNNIFIDLCEQAKSKNAIVYVVLSLKNNKGIYEGQIRKIISCNKNPALQIVFYKCLSSDNTILCDYSATENAGLIVPYADIETFEYEIISTETEV